MFIDIHFYTVKLVRNWSKLSLVSILFGKTIWLIMFGEFKRCILLQGYSKYGGKELFNVFRSFQYFYTNHTLFFKIEDSWRWIFDTVMSSSLRLIPWPIHDLKKKIQVLTMMLGMQNFKNKEIHNPHYSKVKILYVLHHLDKTSEIYGTNILIL